MVRVSLLSLGFFALLWIVFSKAFVHEYSFDSLAVIAKNLSIQDLSNIPDFIFNPFAYSSDSQLINYRPVLLVFNAMNYFFDGLNVASFHLAQIIIHYLNSLAIFVLATYIAKSSLLSLDQRQTKLFACLTALYFALHPLNATAVNYLSARSETLMVFFLLVAILTAIKTGRPYYWISLVSYALGLFCKESAVVFLPLLILIHFICIYSLAAKPVTQFKKLISDSKYFYLSVMLVTVFYLWMRSMAFADYPYFEINGRDNLGGLEYLLNQLVIVYRYVLRVLVPVGLSTDYYGTAHYSSIFNLPVALAILSNITILILLYLKRPAVSLLLLAFIITLLPTSSVITINDLWNEHRQYLASVFIQMIVVYYIVKQRSRYLMSIFLAYLVIICIYTYHRGEDFISDVSYWKKAVSTYPSDRAFGNYAIALMRDGKYLEAERYFYLATQACERCEVHWANANKFRKYYLKQS